MGKPLIFSPGHRIGWLEVLDSQPVETHQGVEQRTHNMWRVWCHYCNNEALVRASSLNPNSKKPNQTCGCRIGGRRGARIHVESSNAFRNILYHRRHRQSGQVAPFINPEEPKKVIVADPEHLNYQSFVDHYGSESLIGVYDDDSTSFDVREDYIFLIKTRCLDGTIDLEKGLDALEALIYKNRRKRL